MFNLDFSVKRERYSTTQGSAVVYLEEQEMARFQDPIELIDGVWQSPKSDESFIRAMLFHPYDELYHVSQPLKNYLIKTYDIKKVEIDVIRHMIDQYFEYLESDDLNAKNEAEEGLFYAQEGEHFVTLDNLYGQCYVEDFKTEVEALCWIAAHDDLSRFKVAETN